VLVALLDADGREDPHRLLVRSNAPAQPKPRPEPGDVLGHDPTLVTLHGDQHAVAGRIRMKHRPDTHPASPAIGRQQLLGGALQPLAVLAAPLRALLLRQPAR